MKRCSDQIRNERLAECLLNSNGNIFQEIKKIRGKTSNFSSRIDGEVGCDRITNHFASIYSKLYNNVNLDDSFKLVENMVHQGANNASSIQLERVTEEVVKTAIQRMKPKKNDAIFDICSDMYLNCPKELITHLTHLLKLYFSHGFVPDTLLLCTLYPLLKDNLGDITASSNYRAIAGGCLLLKLIDLVVLVLEGDKLSYDTMQFAYQVKSSTTICSWSVTAVVDHFNRKGSPVFSAAMDMSKAFDMVKWQELFTTLMDRKVDPLFLRLILFIYTNQKCNVSWCGRSSQTFSVQNGVRQGGVTSGIFFAVYIDKLLLLLRKSGLGCHIHGIFFGAMIFADDIILLSASRTGLQAMVNICHDFAASRNLKFGTNVNPMKSKTKCILFSKKKVTAGLANVVLDGDLLPWVDHIKHLGHTLQADNSMKMDIAQKRGAFIGKVNSLMQEFSSTSPSIMTRLVNTFTTCVYGSNLWDVFSKDCERLYTSFNVAARNILRVHRCTHRYLLEPLLQSRHLKTMILSNFVSFYKSLINNEKLPIRILARLQEYDEMSVLGRCLSKLSTLCNVDRSCLNAKIVKEKICYQPVPDSEAWRIPIAYELLQYREDNFVIPGFDRDEMKELLDYVCTT